MDRSHRQRGTMAAVSVLAGAVGVTGAGVGVAQVVRRRRGRPRGPGGGPELGADFPEAAAALEALVAAGLTVALGESCTGGLLGAALTAVPGSSRAVAGGVIAYSDAAKRDLLAVPARLLEEHGAGSAPVAEAMAEGARAALGADVGVGITGIAGPGREATAKPVGLVVVSACGPRGWRRTEVLDEDVGREPNRAAAVRAGLLLCAAAARAAAAGGAAQGASR